MRTIALSITLLLLASLAHATDAPPAFPLLGRWRQVSYQGEDGLFHPVKTAGHHPYEQEFLASGRWRFNQELIGTPEKPGSYNGSYTVEAPDIYVLHFDYGEYFPTQRVQFHQEGDLVTMKCFPRSIHPDESVTVIKMRRVKPSKHLRPA